MDLSFLMDVIIIEVPNTWGLLLSKEWIAEMGGSVHQKTICIIIPNSNGDPIILYPEAPFIEQDGNYKGLSRQIHVVSEEIEYTCILSNSIFLDEEEREGSWTLEFDGAHSSSGSGVGVVFLSPDKEATYFSYRLEFDCTNNIVEYEALLLGLNLTIDMKINFLHIRGDSYLIVSQVKRDFSAKKPRLKQYRDVVWDVMKNFDEFFNRRLSPEKEISWKMPWLCPLPPYNPVKIFSLTR
jgi:ribonuclease HI